VANGYAVDPAIMAAGAARIDEASGVLGQLLGRLDADVQTMQASWKGPASAAFTTAHTTWVTQQQQLKAALEEMYRVLGGTQQAYVAQELDGQSAFQHVAGQI
jgi:WXG100 family type VII secretion target